MCDIQMEEILACSLVPYNVNYQEVSERLENQSGDGSRHRQSSSHNRYWLERYHNRHELCNRDWGGQRSQSSFEIDEEEESILWVTSIYAKYLYCYQQ
jgi:hypothetical protein